MIDEETHDTLMNFRGGLHANCGIGSDEKCNAFHHRPSNGPALLTIQTRAIYCSPP